MVLLLHMLYQILALGRTGQAVSAAPIEPLLSAAAGNHTTLNTQISPPWASNPGVRDTSDILWSCLLTLTSCVYTAIHLNVPPADEGKWERLRRKLKWVVMALCAPEIILYCALDQFLAARKLVNEMNKLWATQHASDNYVRRRTSIRILSRTSFFRFLSPFAWKIVNISSDHDLEEDMVSMWNRKREQRLKSIHRPPGHLKNFPCNTASSRSWAALLLTCPDLQMMKNRLEYFQMLFVFLPTKALS